MVNQHEVLLGSGRFTTDRAGYTATREYAKNWPRRVNESHPRPRAVPAAPTLWLAGYRGRRTGTVRQAEVHLVRIKTEFGSQQLGMVRPSRVRAWCAGLASEGFAQSYVYALNSRLGQLYSDAVHDGLVAKSPCSRRTSPPTGQQRAYVATTEQVWGLHDAMPERLRAAVLLGAFAGLRLAEVCGLQVRDVDLMRGVISPTVQFPNEPLQTKTSTTPIPIGQNLALELSAHVGNWSAGETVLINEWRQPLSPRTLQRAMWVARDKVDDLPAGFRFQDLRHYFASLLIASGADVKIVQARLRHASAKTTLDTYAHLWPDSDDSTRLAIDAVLQERANRHQSTTSIDAQNGPST